MWQLVQKESHKILNFQLHEEKILRELNEFLEEYDPAAPGIDARWARVYRGEESSSSAPDQALTTVTVSAIRTVLKVGIVIRRPKPPETGVAINHTAATIATHPAAFEADTSTANTPAGP